MTELRLKPSDILYSQDSIMNTFRHGYAAGKMIGETLDDLVKGRTTVEKIPLISVYFKNGKWISFDNRRLWVFKQLELFGNCRDIPVQETRYWEQHKYTTQNGGISIRIRGNGIPGGECYNSYIQQTVEKSSHPQPKLLRASTQRFAHFNLGFPYNGNHKLRPPMMIDPTEIRYTKDVISKKSIVWSQVQDRRHQLLASNNSRPLAVYRAFGNYWVKDENEVLWFLKHGYGMPVSCLITEDNDAFVDYMRKVKPWLDIIDIVRTGHNIQIVD